MPLMLNELQAVESMRKRVGREIAKWLERLYGCWEKKISRGEWKKELRSMKQEFAKDSNGEYAFVLGQLLALAADREDKDTFTWLLEQDVRLGFCMPAIDSTADDQKKIICFLKKRFPWVSSRLFITEKEMFLDELVKRYGVPRVCAAEERQSFVFAEPYQDEFHSRKFAENLPDSYRAILAGNLSMTEYFLRKGGYGSGVYLSELPEDTVRMNLWNTVEYRTQGKNNCDVLSAALLSGSCEMVELILKHFPDLPWSKELSDLIMRADHRITRLVVKYHPELVLFYSAADVAVSRNVILLKVFLEECGRTGRDVQEELLLEVDRRQEELLGGGSKRQEEVLCGPGGKVPKLWERLSEKKRVLAFYQLAFSRFQNREVRKMLLRMIFVDFEFTEDHGLLELFWKYCLEAETDFSDYLTLYPLQSQVEEMMDFEVPRMTAYSSGYRVLCMLYEEKKSERFPVDVYRIPSVKFSNITEKEWKQLLSATIPLRLENKADGIPGEILRCQSPSVLRVAIQKGFVTEINRPALLAEAGRIHAKSEIKMLLLKIPCRRSLMERYLPASVSDTAAGGEKQKASVSDRPSAGK